LYFVQFGRIFCAATVKGKLTHVGQNWKNFHVQSHNELNLLGFSEADIKIKPQRHLIEKNQHFIILPGIIANKVFSTETNATGIVPLIESFSNLDSALWLILSGVPDLQKAKRRRITKLHISSSLLILMTLLAILYMSFGNRSIDLFFRKAKMLFQSRQPVRLDQIPNYLSVDNSNIIKYLERAVNMPARTIELSLMWNTDLPYNVTAAPAFNLDNIYLASDNNLIAFNKKTRKLLWKISLEENIISILSTRNGLIVALEDNFILGFKDDGTKIWQRNISAGIKDKSRLQALELTNNENPRIDGSITIIPTEKGLNVVDSNRGESLSEITLTQKLQYLSDYDSYDSCFYAVVANTIICLELKIIN
ncbi:MAG: PQQ-binding-like beta-propeller repeat protein, partial [Candidatus Cloacimonadaceae bacterium]|nr:PQQ-binding-like beta-propeller repeat protein [Candidatus Cloacimonadaceae bacterium]